MSWAANHLEDLQRGLTVQFRPRGKSMSGRIESGQLVTVVPVPKDARLKKGDIVLCRVNGSVYLHLVLAEGADGRYKIGNNRGGVNGWTRTIYGLVAEVE